jgi:NADH-quinone oxidoreductase subunit N
MNPQVLLDLQKFYPELIIAAALLCVVIADIAFTRIRKSLTFSLAVLGFVFAFISSVPLFKEPAGSLYFEMIAMDPMAVFFKCFLILTSLLVLLATPGSKELPQRNLGEFYALLLGVTLAMLLLASSMDLLMLYLSLEMVSIGSYVMVGYLKNERQSNEASLKYLLFGAVATGSMLYGFTILYGLTGTTKIVAIGNMLSAGVGAENPAMVLVACTLVLTGLGFKTAAVPFHFWCPDVYAGAPTPVTAFLSVAPKAAGFAALIRFFFLGLSNPSSEAGYWTQFSFINWNYLVLIISIITMTLGNIAALRQDNMKRMLAYSSIAHAGYILMGTVVLTEEIRQGDL